MSRARRILFVLIAGLGGVAMLTTLGLWQTQRLFWKQDIIATLEERMAAQSLFVSGDEKPERHNFRRGVADGEYVADEPPVLFLTSLRPFGPGHRVISVFELRRGGRILVDRGFVRDGVEPPAPPGGLVGLTGVLHWPNERGYFTPEPNKAERRWFAREVAEIAEALETEPVMLVLGESDVRTPLAIPVEIDVPDNHLAYAFTWYSLAFVWLVMTIALLRRPSPPSAQGAVEATADGASKKGPLKKRSSTNADLETTKTTR